MDDELLQKLLLLETDVDGALRRFSGNAALYTSLLQDFTNDTTMEELSKSLEEKAWDEAYTAAHALKGLAGNMGFIPLFHEAGELVLQIRKGQIDDLYITLKKVQKCYAEIMEVIQEMDEDILKRDRV